MHYRFHAYQVKYQEGGFPQLTSISTKKLLKQLIKENPEKIYLKPVPTNYAVDEPFEGLLVDAPKAGRYVIAGVAKASKPSNPLEFMIQDQMGSQTTSWFASLEWSDRTKKWRVTS